MIDEAVRQSIERLSPLGQALYWQSPRTLWQRETATLPGYLRQRRRRYRRFAVQQLRPLRLEADVNPHDYDARALIAEAATAGFLSEMLPRPWGTLPWRAPWHGLLFPSALKAEEFCAECSGLGLMLLVSDLGMAPLLLCGHLPTIRRWLVPLCRDANRGRPQVVSFAITEPNAGSDVEESDGAKSADFRTTARRVSGGYLLSGQKVFISGARHADYVCVFAVLEGGARTSVAGNFTGFVVDAKTPGFRRGRSEQKLGQRACDATEIFLDNVFVPERNLIGTERSGWALVRNVLNYSRLPVAAIALGIARNAWENALGFAHETSFGGRPLVEQQEIQLSLARMAADIMSMRGMVWQAARQRIPSQAISAAAKAYCGDMSFDISNRALALIGDFGSVRGRLAHKAMRDSRLTQIYEGTNEINRLAVAEELIMPRLAS